MNDFDKNKCGYTNYEGVGNMNKNEEFKIDKLGWYEDEGGKKIKVIFISKSEIAFATDIDEIYNWKYRLDGTHIEMFMGQNEKLIKYVGPELSKEPRKFEFEGYLVECRDIKENIENNEYILENQFGYRVTDFYSSKKRAESRKNIIWCANKSISKWRVIMEEIIE